jgi:hypothetical protein
MWLMSTAPPLVEVLIASTIIPLSERRGNRKSQQISAKSKVLKVQAIQRSGLSAREGMWK